MKRIWLILLLLAPVTAGYSQSVGLMAQEVKLDIHYLDRKPFAYINESNKVTGLGIEIMQAFIKWAQEKKGASFKIQYTAHRDFDAFYKAVSSGSSSVVGIGNVTVTEERKKEVNFSAPYLNNVSVLMTSGRVETLGSLEELPVRFKGMTAITTKGSVHAEYLDLLRKAYLPDLKIEYVNDQTEIPRKILENEKYFGYVDIITYWNFVKDNTAFVKMHRVANKENEKLAFIFPKKSEVISMINEFFETGFGFTSTKMYEDILEKFLGYEIISTVEIK